MMFWEGNTRMIQQIDAPLREDVRLLGNLLGGTLKLHAGQDLFNQLRQVRALFKGAPDAPVEAEHQLALLVESLEDAGLLALTRALPHVVDFAEHAERYHVGRRQSQGEWDDNAP